MLPLLAEVCALSNTREIFFQSNNNMLAIRIYLSTLTLLFLSLLIANRGLGILEGVVVTCALVYLIIDLKIDLRERKDQLLLLEEVEKRVSLLLR